MFHDMNKTGALDPVDLRRLVEHRGSANSDGVTGSAEDLDEFIEAIVLAYGLDLRCPGGLKIEKIVDFIEYGAVEDMTKKKLRYGKPKDWIPRVAILAAQHKKRVFVDPEEEAFNSNKSIRRSSVLKSRSQGVGL